MELTIPRIQALQMYESMAGITLSGLPIAFKTNYAIERNLRLWREQIQHIEETRAKLVAAIPEDAKETLENGAIRIDEGKAPELMEFLNGEEAFESFTFDGEGLNSEKNCWQTHVKILFPLLNEA